MLNRVRVPVILISLLLSSMTIHAIRPASGTWIDGYREAAGGIIGESMSSTFAWDRLALLGDTFGNRLSGSRALEDAIQWAVAEMK
jgi:hypothetical protein